MKFTILRYAGSTLLLAASLVGCSSTGAGNLAAKDSATAASSAGAPGSDSTSPRTNQCKQSRNACKFEGAYEHGEASYAVLEARRLNIAALKRLRDSAR